MNIEINQGVDASGRIFGYDRNRSNFIVWDFADGRIVVASIDPDSDASVHGSVKQTEKEAREIAAAENRLANSQLRRAIHAARGDFR